MGGNGSAGGGAVGKDRDATFGGEKWWIGGRRADGSERYYPLAPLRYSCLSIKKTDRLDDIGRRIGFQYSKYFCV